MDLLWKERKRIWCGLPLTFTVYSYDNERFYVKSGFLNQRQDEVRLYRIQDLTVTICNQNLKFPVSIEKRIPGIFYLCACISCCIFSSIRIFTRSAISCVFIPLYSS